MELIINHNDVCSVLSTHINVQSISLIRRLLLVSKQVRMSLLLKYLLENFRCTVNYRMDVRSMAEVTHVYQCLSKTIPEYMEGFTASMYGFFNMFPIDINSVSTMNSNRHSVQHYKDMLLSTNIFYVIREWFEFYLSDQYNVPVKAHNEAFSCVLVNLYRCIVSANETKQFPEIGVAFNVVIVRGIIRACIDYTSETPFRFSTYVCVILETFVCAETFENTVTYLYDLLISKLSTGSNQNDYCVHYIQHTITRILKNTKEVRMEHITKIHDDNSYMQEILLAGLNTNSSLNHNHFSICTLLCEIMRYQDILMQIEYVYLHQYISKIATDHKYAVLMHSHMIQFILKLFRQPRAIADYDVIANCVLELNSISGHVWTKVMLVDLQICVRVIMSRLKTQLCTPSWESITCMCFTLFPCVRKLGLVQNRCIFREAIFYASKKVSDSYFLILLENLKPLYAYMLEHDTLIHAGIVKDVVNLLIIPFMRPKIFEDASMINYINATCMQKLFEKIIRVYVDSDDFCAKYTHQMCLMLGKLFVLFTFCPTPHLKMDIICLCTKILQYNHLQNKVTCVHVILMKLFSIHKFEDDHLHVKAEVISALCAVLSTDNIYSTYNRRLNLAIFWNICSSPHYRSTMLCENVLLYCVSIFQPHANKVLFDMDTYLLCQKILLCLTEDPVHISMGNSSRLQEITKSLKITRNFIKKNKTIFGPTYQKYLHENTELRQRLLLNSTQSLA
jgi:hypothetical protein